MNTKNDIIEVSVIIPNFNYGRYIEQCITSVMNSDFPSDKIEIIVIDDASNDNSVSIVKQLMQPDVANIQLIEKPSRTGQSSTRNIGIRESKGRYLFFLDSDNFITPHCIRKHVESLSANPEYSVAYAPIQRFRDDTGENLYVFSNEPFDAEKLTIANYIDNMAMIRKDDFMEVGMFDENIHGWEDYELWLKLVGKQKKMFFIDGEPLSFYRVHDNSWSSTLSRSNQKALKEYIDRKHNINTSEGVENYNSIDDYSINPIDKAKIQIYWSGDESVFVEERSQTKYLKLVDSKETLSTHIHSKSDPITHLRIDIGDRVGFLNIHGITIKNLNGELIWSLTQHEIKQKSAVFFVKSDNSKLEKLIQLSVTPDPFFIVELKKTDANLLLNNIVIHFELSKTNGNDLDFLMKTFTGVSTDSLAGNSQVTTVDRLDKQELIALRNERIEILTQKDKLIEIVRTQQNHISQLNKEKEILNNINSELAETLKIHCSKLESEKVNSKKN